jgi:predicted nucleic acid-binding protein
MMLRSLQREDQMLDDAHEAWHPGSFTKNFGWGAESNGLSALHLAIRVGFGSDRGDVPRAVFRERVEAAGINFFIPANFFLYNVHATASDTLRDMIAFDELVFQATAFEHSLDFDRLALLAFNLSLVGSWQGAKTWQRRPALWSNRYIVERLEHEHRWNVTRVDADDIQTFLEGDVRYRGRTTRKHSTNLAYLYRLGGLEDVISSRIERWWMNAAFLAADRFSWAGIARRLTLPALREAFAEFAFFDLTGGTSVEKRYALRRALEVFVSVGGAGRFARSERALAGGRMNDPRPFGIVDKKLPRAPKALPPGVDDGFEVLDRSFGQLDYDALENFEPDAFVREASLRALSRLRELKIAPTMTSDEIMALTRDCVPALSACFDTSALIDLLDQGKPRHAAALAAFQRYKTSGMVFITDVIFAEASIGMPSAEALRTALDELGIDRLPSDDDEALYHAGQTFKVYKNRQGKRDGVLPDFMIGARTGPWPRTRHLQRERLR